MSPAQVAGLVALVDGLLEPLQAQRVLVAQVDINDRRPGGVGRNNRPFDHLMGVFFHQDAVVERARLALVGIDAEIDGSRMVLGQKGPLDPGGKTGPAAAPQPAGFDQLDHFLGTHLLEHAAQGLVTAALFVHAPGPAFRNAHVGQQHGFKLGHGRVPSAQVVSGRVPPGRHFRLAVCALASSFSPASPGL